ncbi:MAG TPA: hypothetical protein VHH72_07770 [Solirubrobacterales bacterium]|nr:hypothetical protein [Solirubrobacterales bacterium]
MRILLGLVAALVLAGGAVAVWYWEPWAEDEGGAVAGEAPLLRADYTGSACRELAGVAASLAERETDAGGFLRELGRRAAGIREGPRAYGDLARGGRNLIRGKGFLARFDDGTSGQVRHFAGIAVATSYGGGATTRLISIFVRDDPEDSPDGRLTDEGIAFATAVMSAELELELAPRWIVDRLCRRNPA